MFPIARDVFGLADWLNEHYVPSHHSLSMPPRVNIRQSDEEYTIEVVAPGLSRDNFSLEQRDTQLVVSASCEECSKECNEGECEAGYIQREFVRTAFEKRFTLPEHVNCAEISASYADGILTVHVPKRVPTPEEGKRSIPIQ